MQSQFRLVESSRWKTL